MSQCSLPWNADCLSVITMLAMSQEGKKLRKLARRFGLFGNGSEPGAGELLQALHELCHRSPECAKCIARDLDHRFRGTVARIRSLSPEQVAMIEMKWPVPLLWATLTDGREDVVLFGRRLLHGTLWTALHRASAGDEDERGQAFHSLEENLRTQTEKTAKLQRELKEREAKNEELRRLLWKAEQQRPTTEGNVPGNGRLTRELRKVEHALANEREKVRTLSRIMEAAGLILPGKAGPEPAAETAARRDKEPCPRLRGMPGSCAGQCGNGDGCCNDCPLAGLRVAVVGGPCKMLSAYRKTVHNLGAEFLFHDGEVRNGSIQLKGVVGGADIVVFITTVNSHGALNVVKAACRKKGNRFIALRETGAESLAKMLKTAAA